MPKRRERVTVERNGISETNDDKGTQEDGTSAADVKPASKGTASKGTSIAHFIKFVNELLDIVDEDESLKGSYLVMDNARIYMPIPMVRKIEARDYRVMYLPLYSPELNPIEQFWDSVKGKMKRQHLMKEVILSSRIGWCM